MRPRLGEDPDQARADQTAGHDHRDDEAVEDHVHPVEQVVEPFVHEAHLDLAVAHLLEHVVDLVGELECDLAQPQRLLARARRDPARTKALHQQAARVRARDLEDIEVGIEADADRAQGRDRLVEQQEPRRQP